MWIYSYLSRKTITRLISLLSCVMRPPACENNYVNYFFFQHDIDNNNDCNYAMYCCNIAVCRSEAVATLYYTHAHTHTHTHHTHTHTHTHTGANTQIKHLTNQNYYPGQKKKRPLRLCIKSEHCSYHAISA